MKIVIDAEAKEIAELLLALEARQEEKVDVEKVAKNLCFYLKNFVIRNEDTSEPTVDIIPCGKDSVEIIANIPKNNYVICEDDSNGQAREIRKSI